MKALLQGRVELFESGGGDKIQIENTARELTQLGVEVTLSTSLKQNPADFDLVHIFQLDWSPESYIFAKNAKKANKPLVLSPIHHSVAEVKRFDDEYTFGFRRLAKLIFREQHHRDTLKNIYRSVFNWKKAVPTLYSITLGLKKMHSQTLKMADTVLVQTDAEAADLRTTYGVDFKWKKVPNGVSAQFMTSDKFENPLGFSDYIICVGRVEPRKNQLMVIEAVAKLKSEGRLPEDTKLVFVGRNSKNHVEYTLRFTKQLSLYPWIVHIPGVPYEKMPAYYKYAKVCVSASWFETTGLTSLEALYCGTNAVASGARAMEYLNSLASYCDPGNSASIQEAILREYSRPRPEIDEGIKREFTWENAAKKTLEAYNELL